jgi:hypothetical protein
MSPHCKGCVYHHNASKISGNLHHLDKPKPSKKDDWCSKLGDHAPKCIGRCKSLKLKKEKIDVLLRQVTGY